MNFFGHSVVAGWTDAHAGHVLGSMLPDFEVMVGVAVSQVHDTDIQRGIDLHHRTDDAFHRTPAFLGLNAYAVEQLTNAGVRRGTARAVGHIATELFLDGELASNPRNALAYSAALAIAPDGRLRWEDGGHAYATLQGRLAAWGAPTEYADPVFVLARLRDALKRRPALAIADDEANCIAACLPDLQKRVERGARELLDQLRDALGLDR